MRHKKQPNIRADRRRFIMRTGQRNENRGKTPTFMKNDYNCLIDREIYNRAGLIVLA